MIPFNGKKLRHHRREKADDARSADDDPLRALGLQQHRVHLLDLAVRVLELLGKILDAGFENGDALADIGLRQVRKLYLRVGSLTLLEAYH